MYLGQTIDAVLSKNKSHLVGKISPQDIALTLNKSFKRKKIPVAFILETFKEYKPSEYCIGGVFDAEYDECIIVLYFSTRKTFYLTESRWNDFKFLISQAAQHELIHKYQHQFRTFTGYDEVVDLRSLQHNDNQEDGEYLACMDEIDAYAHDIAMEIKYYYPFYDPLYVLNTISKRRKIDSFHYYKNTFENEDWSYIRKLLLKKAYRWLPYVTYTKD